MGLGGDRPTSSGVKNRRRRGGGGEGLIELLGERLRGLEEVYEGAGE
jgi:hypothetical protein